MILRRITLRVTASDGRQTEEHHRENAHGHQLPRTAVVGPPKVQGQVSQLGTSIDEQPRPVSHWKLVHCTASQDAPAPHFTSQPHELPQLTPRHDIEPVQATSHLPVPHSSERHEPVPLHVMLQLLPCAGHVTPERQLFATEHATSQFQPGGQTT